MRSTFRTLTILAGLVVFAAPAAQAQIASNATTVALSATKVEVLTLALSSNTLTNTDLSASNVMGAITATLDWTLSPSRGNVHLVGWFGTTTALTDGLATPNTVSTAEFLGACTSASLAGGTCAASGAFSGAAVAAVGSTASASKLLWTSPAITGTTRNQTGVAIGLSFAVDAARVATLPAGTYTGTLNLRAYAQ